MGALGWSLVLLFLTACQTVPGAAVGQVVAQHEWETPVGRQVTLEVKVVEGPGKGEKVRLVLRERATDEGPGVVMTPGVGGQVPLVAEKRADGLYQFHLAPPSTAWPLWWVLLPILGVWVVLKARQWIRRRRSRRWRRQGQVAMKSPR